MVLLCRLLTRLCPSGRFLASALSFPLLDTIGFSFPSLYFAPSHVAPQRALSLLKLGLTQYTLMISAAHATEGAPKQAGQT